MAFKTQDPAIAFHFFAMRKHTIRPNTFICFYTSDIIKQKVHNNLYKMLVVVLTSHPTFSLLEQVLMLFFFFFQNFPFSQSLLWWSEKIYVVYSNIFLFPTSEKIERCRRYSWFEFSNNSCGSFLDIKYIFTNK